MLPNPNGQLRKFSNQLYKKKLIETKTGRNFEAGVSIPLAKGGAKSIYEEKTESKPVFEADCRPSMLAKHYLNIKCIFFIDEFDRIKCEQTKKYISDTIKSASDFRSETKIIISGISDTTEELIGAHSSTVRNFQHIKLESMPNETINDIIHKGFDILDVSPDIDLANLIIHSCCGLPYFAHLICEELGIYAVTNELKILNTDDLFSLLSTILSKVTDIYSHYFESATRIHAGEFIYGYDDYNPGYPKIPIVHPVVLEVIVMVFSIANSYDRKFISDTSNIVIRDKKLNLPQNYKFVSEEHIDIVFEELSNDGNLITINDGSYLFKDTYCKGYTFLNFANFCGQEIFMKLVAQQIN